MTDKQIIIDDVDVSGCEWLQKWNSRCSLFDGPCGGHSKCDGELSGNCYYKQLQAKEQENEELKAKCKKYGEINEQEAKDYAELKALNTRLDNQRETYWKEYKKLKQTLTEIKDVLNFYANSKIGEKQGNGTYKILLNGGCILNYDPKPAIEALEKISEVLDD